MIENRARRPLSLFYCYAPEDAELCTTLGGHLNALRRSGWIRIWSESTIDPGANIEEQLEAYLQTADVILFVVSVNLIASDSYDSMMKKAMSRHWRQEAVVIPVLLKPCGWQDTWLGRLDPLPKNAMPITSWSQQDLAWQEVALGIRQIVKSHLNWVSIFFAPQDRPSAQKLQEDLEEREGIVLKSLADDLLDDKEQQEVARQMVRSSQAVLLLVSPHIRVLHALFNIVAMYKDGAHVILVWVAGDTWQAALVPSWQQYPLIDARGDHYKQAVSEIAIRLASFTFPSGTSSISDPLTQYRNEKRRNPYKGLRSFTHTDAGDFFGRKRLVQQLVHTLHEITAVEQQDSEPARILALIGSSGSGKSSLLMAGLLPELAREELAGAKWTLLAPIVPGKHPLDMLAGTLADQFPELSLTDLKRDLENDTAYGLHTIARRISQRAGTKVLLLIDQFEELFTQTVSEREQQLFIDIVTTAVSEPRGPLVVVLALRADFYGYPMSYPRLNSLLQKHQIPMLAMSVGELREAIEEPAKLPDVRVTFEEGLVGDMLFDVKGEAGALPLLQFMLAQLFEQRDKDNQMTLEAYEELGGVKGALEKWADDTYKKRLHTEEHRALARLLFMSLVEPGLTLQDTTRRRAALSEFILPDANKTRMLRETIDTFVEARLLTTDKRGDVTTLEVSHEALIREWKLLADWLRAAYEDIPIQRAIHRDAEAWERESRPGNRLYQSTQLKQARAVAGRTLTMLSGVEKVFLDASIQRQRQRSIVSIALILATLLVIGSIIAIVYQINAISRTVVTSLDDNGVGSLRQVLTTAPSGSTITFAPNLKGTITLTSDDLNIAKDLTIQGPGSNIITIRSTNLRSFQVLSGASVTISGLSFRDSNLVGKTVMREFIFNQGKLLLQNVTVSGNVAAHSIANTGTLTCTRCTISGNTALHDGGGISNTGTLTLKLCVISDNTTSSHIGGGLANDYDGTLTLIDSNVTNNRASDSNGGGIANNSGKLTLTNSLVAGNNAALGGGIYNGPDGLLSLTDSTVASNISTNGDGGGIYNIGRLSLVDSTLSHNASNGGNGGGIANVAPASAPASSTLINSTISGNSAVAVDHGGGYGGGIFTQDDRVIITFCTITDNFASSGEGGVALVNDQHKTIARLVIGESIVAANHAPFASDISATSLAVTSSYDLIQNIAGVPGDSRAHHNLVGIAPDLGPLQTNHGSTQTHALLPSSPAIDQIPFSICQKVSTDQRNVKRPQGSACDIGAYEYRSFEV